MKYADFKSAMDAIDAEERDVWRARGVAIDAQRRPILDGVQRVYAYDDEGGPIATFYGDSIRLEWPAQHHSISTPAERLGAAHLRWFADIVEMIEHWKAGTIGDLPASGTGAVVIVTVRDGLCVNLLGRKA